MGAVTAKDVEGQQNDRLEDGKRRILAIQPEQARSIDVTQDISISQKMLSAVIGSIFTSLLVTPLDVVRVRLQSQQPSPNPAAKSTFSDVRNAARPPFPQSFSNLPPNLGVTACCREVFWISNNSQYCVAEAPMALGAASSASADCAVEEVQRKTFNSTFDGMRKIARNEGFTTLWRGLSPTLLMAVPGNVIYFAGYDWLRTSKKSPLHGRISEVYSPLVAGSTARVIAAFFVSPIELFRTRMQAGQGQSAAANFQQTLTGVRDMVNARGVHTLWRGLNLTLWRDVPFSAFYWWGYEAARNTLTDARDRYHGRNVDTESSLTGKRVESRGKQDSSTTLIDSFIAGAVSGGVASVVTTPFDVGKTRRQVFKSAGDSATNADGSYKAGDKSMPRFLYQILREEGVSGLFSGWVPRMLKVAPACAIMISTYEMGKKMAGTMNQRREDARAA